MFEKEYEHMKKRLAKKIREFRIEKGLTQGDLARRMGVSQPFVSKIEKGESLPERKTLSRLAGALGLEEDCLIEQLTISEDSPDQIDKAEAILDKLRNIEDMVKSKYSEAEIVPLSALSVDEKEQLKEIEFPVGAGECFTTDNIVDEHPFPRSLTYGATHMLRVRGQSMEPYVMDTDILLIVPQSTIEHDGQLSVVNIGNHANSVKFVYVEGDLVGLGRSRSEAKWYSRDEIIIQGIVVGKISTLNVIREFEDRAKFKPSG